MPKLFFFICLLPFFVFIQAQNLLQVDIKNLKGQTTQLEKEMDTNQYIILSFWAMWCKPCIEEMDAFNELIDEIDSTYHATLIGISTDDSRNIPRLKPFINTRGWVMPIYTDPSENYKQLLNFENIPYLLVLNPKGEIIYTSLSYLPGKEYDILDFIEKDKKKNSNR